MGKFNVQDIRTAGYRIRTLDSKAHRTIDVKEVRAGFDLLN